MANPAQFLQKGAGARSAPKTRQIRGRSRPWLRFVEYLKSAQPIHVARGIYRAGRNEGGFYAGEALSPSWGESWERGGSSTLSRSSLLVDEGLVDE
jgi:hypothetical protein